MPTIKGGFHIKDKKMTAESLKKLEEAIGRKLSPVAKAKPVKKPKEE